MAASDDGLQIAMKGAKVVLVPVHSDNYAYLLIETGSNKAFAVDPAEADKVLKAAEAEGCEIVGVLTTHHHWDHSGGNEDMVAALPGIKVYGGDDRIKALTDRVGQDSTITLGDLSITVYHTPCHTTGHVLYGVDSEGERVCMFTGDTQFVGGAGKFFEGNGAEMYHAMMEVLAVQPAQTLLFCGHEYTVGNLKFAAAADPDNTALAAKAAWAAERRAAGLPTVPSTVEEELSYNPFMRVDQPAILSYCGTSDPVEAMGIVREKKNAFRG